MQAHPRHVLWIVDPDRVVFELDEQLTPVPLELGLFFDDAGTWGFWVASQTGDVLAVVRATQA